MRIVFFGTPEFSVPALRGLVASPHTVVGVVTQPDRPRGRGQHVTDSPVKAAALEDGLPVIQPNRLREPGVTETLAAWAPDLGVVAAYGKLIPEDMLRQPRLGMINVHTSLLPKYRGAAPVHRAVIDGMTETGVTIMRMVAALDAGAMLAKVVRRIGPDETSEEVERGLSMLAVPLLLAVVDRLAEGPVDDEPQDDSQSTYATRLTKDEGLIDWALPAVSIHNRVRGLHPWPHAYTYLNGARLIVLKSRVEEGATIEAPGTVIDTSGDGIHVATGHGERLALIELQPEGRRAMQARDFLAGHAIPAGVTFTGR
ncbi:MAG TPA: methionyl-tRNA formyltransferase [Vicinamibacterales bacterium]|nr:methionyl-tRNA formyltransferase [Vicinamibacterales bacterium]